MPLTCFACFGGSAKPDDIQFVSPIEDKGVDLAALEAQRRDDAFVQSFQTSLSGLPTDSAETRISQVAAVVLRHFHAKVVRLYGWSTDDVEEGVAGHLVLLAVDWRRTGAGGRASAAAAAAAAAVPTAKSSSPPPPPPPELPDLPGQRIAIPLKPPAPAAAAPASGSSKPPSANCTPLLQQAVHSKIPAVFIAPHQCTTGSPPNPPTSSFTPPTSMPPDCTADRAALSATSFAALPLTSGDRLLGILWVGAAAGSKSEPTGPYDGLPPLPVLRQIAGSVCMCLLGGVDPEYLAWLTGCLRRLTASATLQALIGELCDATAQHVRRRFLVDAVAHAAVVPEPRSTVAFMLDHRPQPGGPGGVARWAAAAAARQANATLPSAAGGGPGGGGGSLVPGCGALRSGMASGQMVRRSDSFNSQIAAGARSQLQRPSSHAPMRPYASASKRSLMEQAAARSAAAAAAAATGTSGAVPNAVSGPAPIISNGAGGGGRLTPGGGGGAHASEAAAAAAALVAGAVPALRAKGFQLSHTLLQRMVSAPEGRGPDGVYAGLTVADCGRHVQDVHQPSRDVCMLMAGGVRGADMTADASDSNIFASERSTGRIAMQSLVLVGIDVGRVGKQQQQQHYADAGAAVATAGAGGGGGGGGCGGATSPPGAAVALYLAFPTRLPPLLVSSAHASCRQLLSVMLARLVRAKVAKELDAEFQTLCAGVPGSYAVVPSTPSAPPPGSRPDAHVAGAMTHGSATGGAGGGAGANGHHAAPANGGCGGASFTPAAATSSLDASGLRGTALEPSIGSIARAGSSKLVPLNGMGGVAPAGGAPGPLGMSLGASAKLLAAFTDAGCPTAGTEGSVGQLETTQRLGVLPAREASSRVFPQTHDGSARNPGGSTIHPAPGAISHCQDGLFQRAEEEEEEEDVSPTHEEGDVMLSSDPRIEDQDEEDDENTTNNQRSSVHRRTTVVRSTNASCVAATAPTTAAAASVRRTGSTAAAEGMGIHSSAVIREQEDDDLFPAELLDYPSFAPRVPTTPAAVLTVSEADGTSSMRQHMGLLVESLMSTLRSTAQIDDHFEGALVSARRSMDLELDDLRLSGVLGDGGSGVVLCGMLGTVPVAVKIIQMPEVDQLQLASTVKVLGNEGSKQQRSPTPKTPPAHGSPLHPAKQAAASPGRVGGAVSHQGQGQVAPYDGGGDGDGGGGGGAMAPGRISVSSSKLKQARRDMLRNAMELAVMRSISHVNITTVYAVYDNVILERVKRDTGSTAYTLRRQGPEDMQTGSKPVFVALCMELCDSGSLASKLEERSFPRVYYKEEEGRGRGTRLLDMVGIYLTVLEVACALRYLHARRLLHRDIKSANILLRSSPTDPRGWTCKLADFGSALVLDQFQPPEEMPVGSPGGSEEVVGLGLVDCGGGGGGGGGRWFAIQEQSWGTITHMSPESMDNNSRVDSSSDIFALGIVMWEIASGRGYRPYKELAPEQIGPAVRRGLRPTFTGEVPLPYRSLAQQCWAVEPHKRPSAVQVVVQIKAQLCQLQSEARSQQHSQHQQQYSQQSPTLPRASQHHPA